MAAVLAVVSAANVELVLTGDVNLNPALPASRLADPTFVWGDLLPLLRGGGSRVLALNHESTLAQTSDPDPQVIKFQDPIGYQRTYTAAGVNASFVSAANNHQFDFGLAGLADSMRQMAAFDIPYAGLSTTAADSRAPRLIAAPGGGTIAFFTIVVDECWVWPNGSLYLDACTCGENNGPPPPYQCYQANGSIPGLWYNWGITDEFIADAVAVVGGYKQAHPDHLVIPFLHVGPNFQWQPYDERAQLLRNLSAAGADIVWGTSSHHIQRLEFYNGKPIIYGMGDLLFRHRPGVDDFCPLYAVPCEQYYPELSLFYSFAVDFPPNAPPRVSPNVTAYATRHDNVTTGLVTDAASLDWVLNTFNELSQPFGASMAADPQSPGRFFVTGAPDFRG